MERSVVKAVLFYNTAETFFTPGVQRSAIAQHFSLFFTAGVQLSKRRKKINRKGKK